MGKEMGMKECALGWQLDKFYGINQESFEARMARILSQIEYKPGFKIYGRIDTVDRSTYIIEFKRHVPDVNNPSEIIPIMVDHTYDAFTMHNYSDQQIVRMIYNQIIEFELHEVMEWFKYQGGRMEDPHPETRSK